MVVFILRQTCEQQNQGSQDIIWIQDSNDPTRIKTSCHLHRRQSLFFSFKNSHGRSSQFRMEWSKISSPLLAFFLSIRKKFPQLQYRKCTSKSHACENAEVFSEVYTCPSAFLLPLDFHMDVSGFGLFCSGKLSFLFKLQQRNVKEKLRCHLDP